MTKLAGLAVAGALALHVAYAPSLAAQEPTLDRLGHALGSPRAPLEVVQFADFACSACAEFARDTWPRIRAELVATGRLRWRVIPFELGFRNSEEGARAAECAADQGGFWAIHDLLFERRSEWTGARNPRGALVELATAAGLDPDAFEACYRSGDTRDRTREATEAAERQGIRATPAFLVGDQLLLGALPFEHFLKAVERAEGGGA